MFFCFGLARMHFNVSLQLKSHRVSTSAAEFYSTLSELISRIFCCRRDGNMFEEKANPEISSQSFKIWKHRTENIDVDVTLGPLSARLTFLLARPVPDHFDGINFTNFCDFEKKQLVKTKPFKFYFNKVRNFIWNKVDICYEDFSIAVGDFSMRFFAKIENLLEIRNWIFKKIRQIERKSDCLAKM